MTAAIPSNVAYYSNGYYYTTDGQQIPISGTQTQETSYISQTEADTLELSSAATSSETCTDGKDDGKIGLLSKIGNVVKGVAKGAVNMVKGALQHPIKTALTVAACCIPVVGPAIAIGLGAYGAYQGVKTIINGVNTANAATTDAEAKEAWQNIGNGTFTTAVSAIAVKGGTSMLKSQLSGSSATVSAIRNDGLSGTRNVLKSAGKETLTNMKAVKDGVIDKTKKTYRRAQDTVKSVKDNGLGNTIRNRASDVIDGATTQLSKVKENINSYETPKAKIENAKALADQAKIDGAKVETYNNGTVKTITYQDGTIMKFSKNGNLTSTTTSSSVGKTGTKTQTEKGSITTEEMTFHNADGTVKNGMRTTTNKKTGITRNESVNITKDGGTSTNSTYNANTQSGVTTKTVKNGNAVYSDTTYTLNGKQYTASELSAIQKGIIRLDTTNAGNIINAKLPISDGTAIAGGILINNELEEY